MGALADWIASAVPLKRPATCPSVRPPQIADLRRGLVAQAQEQRNGAAMEEELGRSDLFVVGRPERLRGRELLSEVRAAAQTQNPGQQTLVLCALQHATPPSALARALEPVQEQARRVWETVRSLYLAPPSARCAFAFAIASCCFWSVLQDLQKL